MALWTWYSEGWDLAETFAPGHSLSLLLCKVDFLNETTASQRPKGMPWIFDMKLIQNVLKRYFKHLYCFLNISISKSSNSKRFTRWQPLLAKSIVHCSKQPLGTELEDGSSAPSDLLLSVRQRRNNQGRKEGKISSVASFHSEGSVLLQLRTRVMPEIWHMNVFEPKRGDLRNPKMFFPQTRPAVHIL